MKNFIKIFIIALVVVLLGTGGYLFYNKDLRDKLLGKEKEEKVEETTEEEEKEGVEESSSSEESEDLEGEGETPSEKSEGFIAAPEREIVTNAQVEELAKKLRDREKRMRNQERMIERRIKDLERRERRVQDLEKNTKELHDQMAQFIPMISEEKKKNIRKLAKMFETLSPENANPLLSQMPDQTIVNVLSFMKPRNSAKILGSYASVNASNAKRAAKLTEMLKNLVL